MHWVAQTEKDAGNAALERGLWDAAGQVRAKTGLKSLEYSVSVLGLILQRFAAQHAPLQKAGAWPAVEADS